MHTNKMANAAQIKENYENLSETNILYMRAIFFLKWTKKLWLIKLANLFVVDVVEMFDAL